MLNEFSLSRGRAMMNFTLKYCDSSEKLLDSYGFEKVVKSFVQKIKKKEALLYNYYLEAFTTEDEFITSLIEVFKLLTVFEVEEITSLRSKYSAFFEDKTLFIELIEKLYDFWRGLERFSIIRNKNVGEGLQNVRFIEANNNFNDLVLSTYRRIEETVMGYHHRVYRQLIAGGNAGIVLNDVQWNVPEEYYGLRKIPFISSVILHPPFIAYTKRNTRTGVFHSCAKNPIQNLVLNENDWMVYPAKVGSLLAFVFFHKDFMVHGITLSNLFELASESDYTGKKPDLIYVFGCPDESTEKHTYYFEDRKNDILIGYANYSDEIDYFGYMKKMLLTLHNIKKIQQGSLPIHGAMVNVLLRNNIQANIIIMGDSGAGKSESLEAFRTLNEKYIKHMRIIFDDMGYLTNEDGVIKGYGTEIGAFVRVDDLDAGYAFAQMDRGIFMNPDQVNARVTIPVSTYNVISKGYKVDYIFYANNYEEADTQLKFYSSPEEAIPVFEAGRRKAKGTTSETGLVESYFANPFGPVQMREETEVLVREYFNQMFANGVKVGELMTELAVEGKEKEGPRVAAEELFQLINPQEK